jgi:hypothetical protein
MQGVELGGEEISDIMERVYLIGFYLEDTSTDNMQDNLVSLCVSASLTGSFIISLCQNFQCISTTPDDVFIIFSVCL